MSVAVQRRHRILSTDALRGGPALAYDPLVAVSATVSTDRRRTVSLTGTARVSREQGSPTALNAASVGVMWRPAPRVQVSAMPSLTSGVIDAQFVATREFDGRAHYIIGRAEDRTVSLEARMSLAITPTFTVEWFAQPFATSVAFSDFRSVSEPHARSREDRFSGFDHGQLREVGDGARREFGFFPGDSTEPAFGFMDPGFAMSSFRSNAVLRWDYRPGSSVYVVWQQDRRGVGGPVETRIPRDLGSGLDEPGLNAVQIRVTYWLGR
jgi:hypothetical protein